MPSIHFPLGLSIDISQDVLSTEFFSKQTLSEPIMQSPLAIASSSFIGSLHRSKIQKNGKALGSLPEQFSFYCLLSSQGTSYCKVRKN